ncbi:hypothetical protein CUMW_006990 [Citrus unshiu]|nr:hypothetical protein CUMW_006990 [Citrus unshiu]
MFIIGISSDFLDVVAKDRRHFLSTNSLDKFLFGENQGFVNWKQRFDIILGTAAARELSYLHEDYHGRIIHRDIKPSNLLDDYLHQR